MSSHTESLQQPDRRRSPATVGHAATARLAVLLMMVIGLGVACSSSDDAGPEQPTYSFVIPAGSAERIENGETLQILPRQLDAELDETIVIANEDDQPHLLGPWYLGAGETLRQRFTTPGVFEDSCSVHPDGEFTVVVSD